MREAHEAPELAQDLPQCGAGEAGALPDAPEQQRVVHHTQCGIHERVDVSATPTTPIKGRCVLTATTVCDIAVYSGLDSVPVEVGCVSFDLRQCVSVALCCTGELVEHEVGIHAGLMIVHVLHPVQIRHGLLAEVQDAVEGGVLALEEGVMLALPWAQAHVSG
ncbi:hypothetical protein D3C85_1410830 [compost metagenome]